VTTTCDDLLALGRTAELDIWMRFMILCDDRDDRDDLETMISAGAAAANRGFRRNCAKNGARYSV
jgi:hypothetical protein